MAPVSLGVTCFGLCVLIVQQASTVGTSLDYGQAEVWRVDARGEMSSSQETVDGGDMGKASLEDVATTRYGTYVGMDSSAEKLVKTKHHRHQNRRTGGMRKQARPSNRKVPRASSGRRNLQKAERLSRRITEKLLTGLSDQGDTSKVISVDEDESEIEVGSISEKEVAVIKNEKDMKELDIELKRVGKDKKMKELDSELKGKKENSLPSVIPVEHTLVGRQCHLEFTMSKEQYESICPVKDIENVRKQVDDIKRRIHNVSRVESEFEKQLVMERKARNKLEETVGECAWRLEQLMGRLEQAEETMRAMGRPPMPEKGTTPQATAGPMVSHLTPELYQHMEARVDVLTAQVDRLLKLPIPSSCSSIVHTGVYLTQAAGEDEAYDTACEDGWTVIQRRTDGQESFFRTWDDYKAGFGNVSNEFWLGNDRIHHLTTQAKYSLRIEMKNWNDTVYVATYGNFSVGSADDLYRLHVANYTGNLTNSLYTDTTSHFNHNEQAFTTYDNDNDGADSSNCAKIFGGGYWYNDCYVSNLNGPYCFANENHSKCMVWWGFTGRVVLKEVTMKVKEWAPN